MNIDRCVDALSMPLPEDILKRKWAGDLEGAIQAIDLRLGQDMPEMLRDRLVCERERLLRLPTQYPWNREQALEKLHEVLPSMTEQEFDQWELAGKVDFIYLHGEKRYFVRFHKTLAKYPELSGAANPNSPWLDPMIRTIKEKGHLRRRITLHMAVYCEEDCFTPGEYLVHLPFPAACAQQSDIHLLSGDPDGITPEDSPARTAWWNRPVEAWQKFELTYSYVSCIRYADPLHAPAPAAPLYPNAAPPCADDLGESGAYIRFTPYLRALAAELSRGCTTPVEKAWRFYEFITTQVKYSFMRDYFQVDDLGEYCAVNLKGDCGLQALLFIILCRIAGIPARWQSGLSIDEDGAGSHDWAQFYLEGWGWLFCDPSYGGGALRRGSAERHAFYFGNIDPMRMVANRVFQAPLMPEKQALRVDPYDNQSGEMERKGSKAPFNGRQLNDDGALLGWEDLD